MVTSGALSIKMENSPNGMDCTSAPIGLCSGDAFDATTGVSVEGASGLRSVRVRKLEESKFEMHLKLMLIVLFILLNFQNS